MLDNNLSIFNVLESIATKFDSCSSQIQLKAVQIDTGERFPQHLSKDHNNDF